MFVTKAAILASFATVVSGLFAVSSAQAGAPEDAVVAFNKSQAVRDALSNALATGLKTVGAPTAVRVGGSCGFAGCDEDFIVSQALSTQSVNATSASVWAIAKVNTALSFARAELVQSDVFTQSVTASEFVATPTEAQGDVRALMAFNLAPTVQAEIAALTDDGYTLVSSGAVFLNGQCGFAGCDERYVVVSALSRGGTNARTISVKAVVQVHAFGETEISLLPKDVL